MKKRLGRSPDRGDAVVLAFTKSRGVEHDPAAVSLLRGLKLYA
jgi:hypothetical protein